MGQTISNTMNFVEMQILFFLIGIGATSASTLPDTNRAKGSFEDTEQFSSGLDAISDFVAKHTLKKCDKKQLDEVELYLNNMIDMKDAISKEKLHMGTVAGGLFHIS